MALMALCRLGPDWVLAHENTCIHYSHFHGYTVSVSQGNTPTHHRVLFKDIEKLMSDYPFCLTTVFTQSKFHRQAYIGTGTDA